ncbi:penicillin-binding protein 1C [Legionella sp. CNM-4043-24]|uniref:penicillin-binding protein 1C n=1 Tax=Legionella sp. CNM-4043-24 TaxID=3421646 RepID=UPI00403AB572
MSSIAKYIRIILVGLFVSGLGILFFCPRPPLLEGLDFSTVVYDSQGRLLRLTLNKDDKFRVFTPLSDISPQMVSATLLQEDQYFRWHPGINPVALITASWQTWGARSRRMGASTITMQVARLRFGINSKTLSGKVQQIARALQLERHYSKDQILEAYLNLAPYGGNIEGVGAASLIYFNKKAGDVSLPDVLTLSVIPQNPNRRTPRNLELKHIRDRLFDRWLKLHPEDAIQQAGMQLPLQMQSPSSLPFAAPHFVNTILRQNHGGSDKNVVTTLDLRLQTTMEHVTQNYIKRRQALGVYNAAVLLVDTRDMGIRAMLGSAGFHDVRIGGQINGTEIKRSPGSTLKPFIYGLALDQGLIHPNTVLKDVPRSFGSYNPENFDYDFIGPVRARDALVLSRNIPALQLASQLSSPGLYQLLIDAEVSHLKSESWYGLSMALGGAELSMQELAGLYAMLVNDGLWQPLRMQEGVIHNTTKRLLSPEASFLVLDMLKDGPQPEPHAEGTDVAWKTGTSSGYRDAWSVGQVGPYVLAVWVGNFDNSSNPAFVGKNIAAPLFFELIEAIKHEKGAIPRLEKHPEKMNLTRIPVCKASGMLPTRYCQDQEMTWFIPGKSPIKTDTIYREVAIDNLTGLRTCHFDDNTRFEIFEFWPSDLLAIFRQAGIQRRIPPFFSPDCAFSSNHSSRPQITSPQTDRHYIIRADSSGKNSIPLSAITDADVAALYWFIDNRFLTKTKPDNIIMWPARAGHHVIRVVDDHGLADARDLNVELER